MDSKVREKLEDQLCEYVSDTLTYTETVKEFCDNESKWTLQRERELDMMKNIKERVDQISLKFEHVQKAEHKAKALGEYIRSSMKRFTADSRRQELEKELGEVLMDTLNGLEKLQLFLDAMEKLAVTSLFVLMDESFMPKGVTSMALRSVISAARTACPLLIHFKRDTRAFCLPILSNLEVLTFMLDKYIRVTQQICEKIEKKCKSIPSSGGVYEWENGKTSLKFHLNMSEESVQKLSDHLTQLTTIRLDKSFRITFLFGERSRHFIDTFSKCHDRMLQFLSDLEEAAVQLDRMKKGSNISTVAGSSVSIVGGFLSIVGLALAPVTAGVSLVLTCTGVGLGVTSGVNGIVTSITEMAVNSHHRNKANNLFTSFIKDVQKIQKCMEVEEENKKGAIENDGIMKTAFEAVKLAIRVRGVIKGADALVDMASVMKPLRSEKVAAQAVNMGLQEVNTGQKIPQLAAELPDVGQLAKGTPLALTKSARAAYIGLNAVFIGLDVAFICNGSISLAKGSKNEIAELIRLRSALWRMEVEGWEMIHNQLSEGISGFDKICGILEQPFLP